MDFNQTTEHMTAIQKDITSTCMSLCFNKGVEKCVENCYTAYIQSLKEVNKMMENRAYDCESLYAYKLYPRSYPYEKWRYTGS